MKYLLDTHTVLWWWIKPEKLSVKAVETIKNPDHTIFVSPINLWEMSIKFYKGKWDEAKIVVVNFEQLMVKDKFELLPTQLNHARLAGGLPQNHTDPFDRMLVAQTISENLTLISKDEKLYQFDVKILW